MGCPVVNVDPVAERLVSAGISGQIGAAATIAHRGEHWFDRAFVRRCRKIDCMLGLWTRIGRPRQLMVGLSVVLAFCLWGATQARRHEPLASIAVLPSAESGQRSDFASSLQTREPPSLETFSAIDERPLFSASRRPLLEQGIEKGGDKPERIGAYILQGIVIGENQRIALLVDPATRKTLRLAEGEGVGGWVARKIGEDYVHFESGGMERIVKLAETE